MDDTEVYIVVARQKALADELTKLKINFKKDGLGRKTSKYKSDRLQRLEAIWQEFVTTISESSSTSKRIHHMSLGTYQKGFILLIAILMAMLEEIQTDEDPDTLPPTTGIMVRRLAPNPTKKRAHFPDSRG